MGDEYTMLPAMGWYADPRVPRQLRWWDGEAWTNHVHMPDAAHANSSDPAASLAGPSGEKWDWPQP